VHWEGRERRRAPPTLPDRGSRSDRFRLVLSKTFSKANSSGRCRDRDPLCSSAASDRQTGVLSTWVSPSMVMTGASRLCDFVGRSPSVKTRRYARWRVVDARISSGSLHRPKRGRASVALTSHPAESITNDVESEEEMLEAGGTRLARKPWRHLTARHDRGHQGSRGPVLSIARADAQREDLIRDGLAATAAQGQLRAGSSVTRRIGVIIPSSNETCFAPVKFATVRLLLVSLHTRFRCIRR
jgi:hypothetical protein